MKFLKTCVLGLLVPQVVGYPLLPVYNATGDWIDPAEYKRLWPREDLEVALRVLPLGASITYGTASTDGNGYRKALRDAMRFAGHPVNMIGSRRNGNMRDNHNEGWPGYVISQVHEKAKTQYRLKPNLVLINAGTNDCTKPDNPITAPGRMEALVDDIFANIPDVTIILSGLLPNSISNTCTKLLNTAYGQIVERQAARKRKIVFADTYNGYLTLDDLADGTHPDDHGYRKLASIWWNAFTNAKRQGFITIPHDNGLPEGTGSAVCDKYPGEYYKDVQTQRGSGTDDGNYKHLGVGQGELLSFKTDYLYPMNKLVFWADLDGDGLDEFIW